MGLGNLLEVVFSPYMETCLCWVFVMPIIADSLLNCLLNCLLDCQLIAVTLRTGFADWTNQFCLWQFIHHADAQLHDLLIERSSTRRCQLVLAYTETGCPVSINCTKRKKADLRTCYHFLHHAHMQRHVAVLGLEPCALPSKRIDSTSGDRVHGSLTKAKSLLAAKANL